MNPEQMLTKVGASIDLLVAAGEPHGGLFPSLLDLGGRELAALPPPIAGQRMGDRAFPGSNLIHDEAVLRTMYALSDVMRRPDWRDAADRYLRRFATHCTDTVSGLFPWGEHAFWHLAEDRVGNGYADVAGRETSTVAIHDHLRQAPLCLWEKLWELNPACVVGFAQGLDYHYKAGDPPEYTRHAPITDLSRLPREPRSCDFPRHSGFYIYDWSFAWLKTGRAEFINQIRKISDYWWEKRHENGLLLSESRGPVGDPRFPDYQPLDSPSQTMGLATSLWESAILLEHRLPELAAEMRRRAAFYTDGFLGAPHDLARGVFVMNQTLDGQAHGLSQVWGSVYGEWPASYVALFCCGSYRWSGVEGLLDFAMAAGEQYVRQGFPGDLAVPAMDAGMALGLLADLFDITKERRWLDGGLALADRLVPIYFDSLLPRGAAGIDWYESQMGPSFLLHGLARLALLATDRDSCSLGADYTGR